MKDLGITALDNLIEQLARLPGIGRKTAQRLALFILKSDSQFANDLAEAILSLKQNTHLCKRCFNIAENELCTVCTDASRDRHKICVVEDIVDVMAIEETHTYRGLYHVLGGVISPLAGITPDQLHIAELIRRIQEEDIDEVLLAINPSTEGETTIIYLSEQLKPFNIKITRLASGIPIGSHLEYLDMATIGRAIQSRQEVKKD